MAIFIMVSLNKINIMVEVNIYGIIITIFMDSLDKEKDQDMVYLYNI